MKRAFGLLGASLATLIVNAAAASPPVKVSLRSSWPAPPLLAEIIETVSLENPEGFFLLLDRLTDWKVFAIPGAKTPEAIHQVSLQVAVSNGLLSEPGAVAAVEMNLALHAATPKIEAFYQHYGDHHSDSAGSECGSWVDWYGEVVCDVHTLMKLAGVETIDPGNKPPSDSNAFLRPKILPFDHIFPSPARTLERPPRTAILYASLSSKNFRPLHTYLLSLAESPVPHVEYVFRHIPPKTRDASARSQLSGYGVSLDLKKTDYLAVDDRHSQNQGSKEDDTLEGDGPESESGIDRILALIQAHPEPAPDADASSHLNEEELHKIGSQAAQLIADSSEPLVALTQLSQNFPQYATSLARRVVVNSSLEEELHELSLKVQGGINMFWLNGATLTEKDVNPLELLKLLRKERTIIQSLTSLGLSRAEAQDLLTHKSIGAAQSDKGVLDGLLDASDRPEEGGIITWWNDIETDSRYARWSPSIHGLIRAMYPGQFPSVKLNLFNVIIVLDLSHTTSLNFIAGPVDSIIERNFPFHFGVVPTVETEDGTRMARLFYHLVQTYGRKKTMAFLRTIAQPQLAPHLQEFTVRWDLVRSEFQSLLDVEGTEEGVETSLDAILDGKTTPEATLEKVQKYTERLGTTLAASPQGHAFINGKHHDLGENFLRQMQTEITQQMSYLQEQAYEGKLVDDNIESMTNYFYDLPTTSKRRNRHIVPTVTAGSLRIYNLPDLFSRTGFRVTASSFVYPPETEKIPLSIYVIADLDSEAGLSLVQEALNSIDVGSQTRISFIHNPSAGAINGNGVKERAPASWLISHLLSTNTLSKTSPSRLLRALGLKPSADPRDSSQTPLSREATILELTDGVTLPAFNADRYADYVKASRLVIRELQFPQGQQGLVVNGRVVGPLPAGEFVSADFKTLEGYEIGKRSEPVMKALESVVPSSNDLDRASYAHLVSMSSSVIAAIQLPDPSEFSLFDAPQRPRQRIYEALNGQYTVFESGDNSTALYHIVVLLEPLSETAQKWSSLLRWLATVPDTFVKVHLNPAHHTEIPLKRFYRYNLLPSLSFDNDGLEVPAQAVFENLPVEPIYTLAMDVPTSWLVRPREALYDLDNIQLGSLSPEDQSVDAVFDLDYLVVEGHAREGNTKPPRGVQLQLITKDGNPIDDTQVVANLGYLQFKAKPGVFRLEIRDGRGRDIYQMDSVGNEGWDSPSVEEVGSEITVTSFEGLTLYPRLSRKYGMEMADVLEELEETKPGIFERVFSVFKSKEEPSNAAAEVTEQAEINIFTVASGLLYERFVSIMILSVLKNTKSTVKFWFIENFLSPSFLEFIPHLAETYGFKYELVTYKWPSWLRAQKEKQRIIWAYKILFLDVLFPMDLKKVIFVDADQIVRADLKELVDLDLQGAPYGYTPMGDDNTDMEGFRFWKTGYWKEFLAGKPYHISALYVIDLVRFRQLAAGDILRGQYQQLSADPNSLANLDQDLPNNLQREVPIFSLHEDWLWCETWCSKDRLHRAKTIDLCQNPLTKEPKLTRARQIPEWEEYDAEISRFARKLAEEGIIKSRIAAADANVLASAGGAGGAGASSKPAPDTETNAEPKVEAEAPEHSRDEL